MEPLLSVLPQHQRKISPPAIQKHKSASMGYVNVSFQLSDQYLFVAFKIMLFKCYVPLSASLDQACSGSICSKYGLEVCTCASEEGKDEAAELCHVCCMEKSK